MGFADRLRAWFRGETKTARPAKPATATPASRAAVKELEGFVADHAGVEGFIEPATTVYPTTLLLVAGSGEYLRRPILDRDRARKLCDKHDLPLYDAAKVGYPKRMREFDQGMPGESIPLEDLPPWPGDEPGDPGDDGTADGPTA